MKKAKKLFAVLLTVVVLAGALTGCNKKNPSGSGSTAAVKTIIVGTGNTFNPVSYFDTDGNLIGFEPALLREIDKRLPQYEFKLEPMAFLNILISLDAGKVDFAAHSYTKNEERVKKYLFNNESYAVEDIRIVVDKERTDINSIEDLNGKTIYVDTGTNNAYLAEKYNKEHNTPWKLAYGNIDNATLAQNLINGTYDATFAYTQQVENINQEFGEKVKAIGQNAFGSEAYYITKPNETELVEALDSAIRELKQDGTLARLHLEWYSEQSIPSDALRK
jgi:ABC-type amino acid transport substrate-binding protein